MTALRTRRLLTISVPMPPEPTRELPPEEAWRKAKEVCFDLLAARPRTKEELRQALRRRGFADDVSERLLGKLDEAGLVDDAAFAEMWVRSRHTHRGSRVKCAGHRAET